MPTLNDILHSDQTNTEEVVNALKKALEEEYAFRGLSVLELSNGHGLESAALVNLFKALEDNNTITNLQFRADLSNEVLDALITTLQKNQHLRDVYLASSRHPNLVTKLAHLLENNLTSILKLSLDLDDRSLNAQSDAKIFARALEKNYTLNSLELYGGQELLEACEGLQKNKTIKKSTLSYKTFNEPTQAFGNVLKQVLKQNHTLKSLKVQSNCNDIPILAEALQDNRGLTHLNLRGEKVNGDTLRTLSASLQQNKTLTSLNLAYNGIKDTDIPALIELCTHNPQLMVLDLSDNQITFDDVQLLTFLKTNQSLKTLNLSIGGTWTKITNEGVEKLAEALQYNTGLTNLNLTNNQINDKRFRVLATVLQKNKHLTSLNLSNNQLSDKDVPALIELCTNMPNLIELNLESNWMTPNGIQEFSAFLETNKTLTNLNLNNSTAGLEIPLLDIYTGTSQDIPKVAQAIQPIIESLKKNTELTTLGLRYDFTKVRSELLASELRVYYNAFEELLKVNKTLIILDISPPLLGWLSDPAEISSVQEAYARVQKAIKENQTKIVVKHVQEAITPHKVGEINPLLNIIADYVGSPSIAKKVPPEATTIPPSVLTSDSLNLAVKAPLPFSGSSPKQLSILGRLKQKLRTAWNKLYVIIYNAWDALKNKFKLKPKTTHASDDFLNKSALTPDLTIQGQKPKDNLKPETAGLMKKSETLNRADDKIGKAKKQKTKTPRR